jgi:hypothetical protein
MSEVRQRRPSSWAIVELTRMGERKAEDGTLAPLLRDAMSLPIDHPVFIPSKTYVSGGRRITIHLMEGYVFIGSDGRDLPQPSRLDQPYVRRLLTTPTANGGRVLSVLTDQKVKGMEADLAKHIGDDSKVGSNVSVTTGMYSKMEGVVIDTTTTGNLVVRFRMRSLDVIAEVPRSFTVPSDKLEGDDV